MIECKIDICVYRSAQDVCLNRNEVKGMAREWPHIHNIPCAGTRYPFDGK